MDLPTLKIKKSVKGDRTVLTLSGELTVHNAEKLKNALLDALNRSEELDLEFGEIKAVDITFLQILYSARKTAGGRDILHFPDGRLPESIRTICEIAGFAGGDEFFAGFC